MASTTTSCPDALATPLTAADAPPNDSFDEVEPPRAVLVGVGEIVLAIPLGGVREVVRARPATRIPGAPPWVAGIVAIRGVAVPVADLVRRSDADTTNVASWLVLIEEGGCQLALGVTAVKGVYVIDDEMADALSTSSLPCRGSVRLLVQDNGRASGAPVAVDVLDVAAVVEELFDGD